MEDIQPYDWVGLCEGIRAGKTSSLEEFYKLTNRGIRFFVASELGPEELEDHVNDTFLGTVIAIQDGNLRDPNRLLGFVRTIVRRQIFQVISDRVASREKEVNFDNCFNIPDRSFNGEHSCYLEEKREIMRWGITQLRPRQKEIVERTLNDEDYKDIQKSMHLDETQYRLLKSRSLRDLADICKSSLRKLELIAASKKVAVLSSPVG